eukprot:1421199-Alexandrium_andersonii.AAC.1
MRGSAGGGGAVGMDAHAVSGPSDCASSHEACLRKKRERETEAEAEADAEAERERERAREVSK